MESTLQLKKSDFYAKVGRHLGYGLGADNGETAWSARQLYDIKDCVDSAVRQFYKPPPEEGSRSSYDWSFLRPVASLTLDLGAQTIPLPDDFGGIEGPCLIISSSNQIPYRIEIVHWGAVAQRYAATPDQTGRPLALAVQPLKGTGLTSSSKSQLYVFPAADAAYTFSIPYYILPDCLSDNSPYAYGGATHAETILASCLAVAEERLDNQAGVLAQKWKERLKTSVDLDRRNKAQQLGYNGDGSEDGFYWRPSDRHWLQDGGVTINGVLY